MYFFKLYSRLLVLIIVSYVMYYYLLFKFINNYESILETHTSVIFLLNLSDQSTKGLKALIHINFFATPLHSNLLFYYIASPLLS